MFTVSLPYHVFSKRTFLQQDQVLSRAQMCAFSTDKKKAIQIMAEETGGRRISSIN